MAGYSGTKLARVEGSWDMGLSERLSLDSVQPGGDYTLTLEGGWGRLSFSQGYSDRTEQKETHVGMSQNSKLVFAACTISV